MPNIIKLDIPGYEKVIEVVDKTVGLHAFIAVHNTTLGPGLGGTRIFPYATREDALKDVLRLAEGMTYKAAIAKVGLGGAKGVIMANSYREKSPKLLQAYAEAVNSLDGQFITAEDVGSTTADVAIMRQVTPHLVGLPIESGSGDPSPFAAWGVYKGMQAVCHHLFGSSSLKGKRIAIQGLGKVGSALSGYLFWQGAELIITDIKRARAEELGRLYDAQVVPPDQIHKVPCDIFSPSALGGIINKETIADLKCKAIAGSANNQLDREEDALELARRGILYAPDFVINAGGLINASFEISPTGYRASLSRNLIDHIYDTLVAIMERSKSEEKTTEEVALDIAKYNIEHHIGKRQTAVVHTR